jgi:hypothetical protein
MKRILLLLLCFLLVVFLGIISYFLWFSPSLDSQESSALSGDLLEKETSSGQQSLSGMSDSFEESFYQDLSDFFNSDTNYYQNIEGEY